VSKWQYAHGAPVTAVVLDPYEWTNLLGLLEDIMENPDLSRFNSGDWVGQLRWKLPTRDETYKEAKSHAWYWQPQDPNKRF